MVVPWWRCIYDRAAKFITGLGHSAFHTSVAASHGRVRKKERDSRCRGCDAWDALTAIFIASKRAYFSTQNTATRLLKYKIKAKTHFFLVFIRLSIRRLRYGVQRPTSKFLCWKKRKKREEKEKEKKREMVILKSGPKPDDRKKITMIIINLVQIHDEQRSIQMTIVAQRYTQKRCSDKHCDYK